MSFEKPIQNEDKQPVDSFVPARRPGESDEEYRDRAESELEGAKREARQQARLKWPNLNKDLVYRAERNIQELRELGEAIGEIVGTGTEGRVENYDVMNAANKERLTNKNAPSILERMEGFTPGTPDYEKLVEIAALRDDLNEVLERASGKPIPPNLFEETRAKRDGTPNFIERLQKKIEGDQAHD